MHHDWQDEQIRNLFGELKQDEGRRVPSFARVWQSAISQRDEVHRRGTRFRCAVATLVVLVGASAICDTWLRWHSSGRGQVARAQHAIRARQPALPMSRWRSPTAFLLEFSNALNPKAASAPTPANNFPVHSPKPR